jgi:hypothetical protein
MCSKFDSSYTDRVSQCQDMNTGELLSAMEFKSENIRSALL